MIDDGSDERKKENHSYASCFLTPLVVKLFLVLIGARGIKMVVKKGVVGIRKAWELGWSTGEGREMRENEGRERDKWKNKFLGENPEYIVFWEFSKKVLILIFEL